MKLPKNTWFGDSFKEWILAHEPKKIPIYRVYTKHDLEKSMNDYEIQKNWNIEPYSIPEFLGLITFLIKEQPKGEKRELLTNGYTNIFYVNTPINGVVAVVAGWSSGVRGWGLRAYRLGSHGWGVGDRVFSRSADLSDTMALSLENEVIEIKGIKYKLIKP